MDAEENEKRVFMVGSSARLGDSGMAGDAFSWHCQRKLGVFAPLGVYSGTIPPGWWIGVFLALIVGLFPSLQGFDNADVW